MFLERDLDEVDPTARVVADGAFRLSLLAAVERVDGGWW